jgi:hypothetical protein
VSAFLRWLRPHLTPAKIVISLLITGVIAAVIYSEIRGGVEPRMLSPFATGKAQLFTSFPEGVSKSVTSSGSSKVEYRVGTADWHYHWQIEGKTPVTDDNVLDELFKEHGIEIEQVVERGAPGGTVKADYKTDAGGGGWVKWTVAGPAAVGPWEVDMTVHETLRSERN